METLESPLLQNVSTKIKILRRYCCVVVALLLQNKPTVSNGWRIVVVGKAKMTTVSKMRIVAGQGRTLAGHHFTKARASKWSKVTILPRPDARAEVTSANNNILYRIYNLFNNNNNNFYRRDDPNSNLTRGHTADRDSSPTPWEQLVRHIPYPAFPPYYTQTPHCMAPRRWRILSPASRTNTCLW